MTGHKFTDEEVIKALENCGSTEERVTHCKGCPLYEYGSSMCIQTVMGAALDLINRQKAEIEALTNAVDNSTKEFLKLHDVHQEQKKVIEMLKAVREKLENLVKEMMGGKT